MPRYHYTAIARNGKKSKGTLTAESPYAARKQIRVRNMHPTSVEPVSSAQEGKSAFLSAFGRGNKNQVIEFTKQMATLLNSGIKLTEALSVLAVQVSDSRFQNAITDIRDRVVTGESLTDAMKDYGDFFDVIYISMVRVGEVTGYLGENFATVAGFMERRRQVEAKIMTAMIYPIVLTVFCFLAIMVLTIFVIPEIADQIARAGHDLPWITVQLMRVGHVFTSWWVVVLLGSAGLIIYSVKRFLRTPRGALLRDKLVLWLPLLGPLIKQRVVARFASTLSTLLGSGMSMSESLRVVSEVTGNSLMIRAVNKSRERILAGADIATPLRDSGVIDPTIAHMVSVGERSGELEKMLRNISDDLEANTDIVIERLSAAVEPLIIIFMAVAVGVIAYATLLPILEVSGNF